MTAEKQLSGSRAKEQRPLLAGKSQAFWDKVMLEGRQGERKESPKPIVTRIPRDQMKTILHGISNKDHLLFKATFKSISTSFPKMNVEDVIEICNTTIRRIDNEFALSPLLILADSYVNAKDIMKPVIELALLRGINVCEKNGWTNIIVDLLRRTDLSDAVMIRGIKILRENRWISSISELLGRIDLSDTVRNVATKIVKRHG